MSDGPTIEAPRHVELAAIDEDVRRMAIYGSRVALMNSCINELTVPNSRACWLVMPAGPQLAVVARALRVLRHFGLLVEHGDGVVSIKEQP